MRQILRSIYSAITKKTVRQSGTPTDPQRRALIDRAVECAKQQQTPTPLTSQRRPDALIEVRYANGDLVLFCGPGRRGEDRFQREFELNPEAVRTGRIKVGSPPPPMIAWTSERLIAFIETNCPDGNDAD